MDKPRGVALCGGAWLAQARVIGAASAWRDVNGGRGLPDRAAARAGGP